MTMEPGRELDAKIAVGFFGWQWRIHKVKGAHQWERDVYPHHLLKDVLPTPEDAPGIEHVPAPPRHAVSFFNNNVPHYSTNIAAAWAVVERVHETLRSDGAGNYLSLICRGDDWYASFAGEPVEIIPGGEYPYDTYIHSEFYEGDYITDAIERDVLFAKYIAIAPTAPHAICLAALKALEEE